LPAVPRFDLKTGTRQLNRLVASRIEVERSARAWGAPTRLLIGSDARRATLLESLNRMPPAVVHLATHVVGVEGQAGSFLALTLGAGANPELVGAPDIAMLQVPGSLIVMTGCASGSGEAWAGAGLLGLTRAWLAAGAGQVLATQWPVEDSGGDLLPYFFDQYKRVPAAEALRRGQVAMLHSGTWQADPAYWGAFQLTGGAH
jgi:CHAT domain-containing protein